MTDTNQLSNAEIEILLAASLASALEQYPERDPVELADHVRDYCCATLRAPRQLAADPDQDIETILSGIVSGALWPTDRGLPSGALFDRWEVVTHEALHLLTGTCPFGGDK